MFDSGDISSFELSPLSPKNRQTTGETQPFSPRARRNPEEKKAYDLFLASFRQHTKMEYSLIKGVSGLLPELYQLLVAMHKNEHFNLPRGISQEEFKSI